MYNLDELIESYNKLFTMYLNETNLIVREHLKDAIEERIREIKEQLDITFATCSE